MNQEYMLGNGVLWADAILGSANLGAPTREHCYGRRRQVTTGVATAIGAALGAAYGASSGQLALCVALGAAAGATLDVVVHFINRWRRTRTGEGRQP